MRWEMKAAIQAALSRIPFGSSIHRRLQDLAGTTKFDANVEYWRRARFLLELRSRGLPIEGKSFLEIGTGWYPMLPMLLHALRADRIVTVDLHRWLTRAAVAETTQAVSQIAESLPRHFGASAEYCRHEMHRVNGLCVDSSTSINEVLREAAIDYRAPADAACTGLPDGEIDYVVSTNVFEHVRPDAIVSILEESKRILKPGGYIVHHIDPGDHFAYDKRITTANFLQFSPQAWYYIGGSGLAYHNRLRCIDFLRLIEEAGFHIVHQSAQVDSRALEALRSGHLKTHESYKNYTPEQLCEGALVVLACTPDVPARVEPRKASKVASGRV